MLLKLSLVCSGTRQQQFGLHRDESYSLLEAQHAELKKKVRLAGFTLLMFCLWLSMVLWIILEV